jgi:hypothetical protein
MRLSDYIILERVATRTIQEGVSNREPSVLMKMDIEGSELEVIMDLILTGNVQLQNFSRLKKKILVYVMEGIFGQICVLVMKDTEGMEWGGICNTPFLSLFLGE